MPKRPQRRSPTREAKRARKALRTPFALVIQQTECLWRRFHLTYDQAIQVAKHVRARLSLDRPAKRPMTALR